MGRTQPGGRVDEEVYEQFRQFVKRQHGQIRGSLGDELEIAMKERMNSVNQEDQLTRIENQVAHLNRLVAETQADADGGAVEPGPDPSDAEPHTHTRDAGRHIAGADSAAAPSQGQDDPVPIPDERPHHRASSRQDRAAWLYAWVRDMVGPSGQIRKPVIRNRASKVWGYDRDSDLAHDLADRTADLLEDAFDAEEGPDGDEHIVWGPHADEVWQDALDDQQADASRQMDALDDADQGDPLDDR